MVDENPYLDRCFGNYQITDEIDCGHFGCVYRAQHKFLSRIAAVKLLHATLLHSSTICNEFLQEAQILERLKHPHILPIYEFGIEDSLPYLIVEYALGGSLRNLLEQWSHHPLPMREAISIISQIGYALAYAHQRDVIHHDLKPENILFNSRGKVLLADFGIAIIRTAAPFEPFIRVNGTPAYMAPEQFHGRVSRRSDQYALGCIAYELVTGHQPFTASDTAAMGLKHTQEYPIPPTRFNAKLPLSVEQAILKALAKRRINRYPDVLTFIRELQSAF